MATRAILSARKHGFIPIWGHTHRRHIDFYEGWLAICCGDFIEDDIGGIVIEETTGSNVVGYIAAGEGQTQMSQYTVPAGYTAYLRHTEGSVSAGTNKDAALRMYQRQNGDDVATPFTGKRLVHKYPSFQGEKNSDFFAMPSFPAKTDLWWTATGNAATSVAAKYCVLLVAD